MNADNTAASPDRIAVGDPKSVAHWAQKLSVSEQQIQDAVAAAGDKASDVEMHPKGTRSTTNDDRIEQAGAGNS